MYCSFKEQILPFSLKCFKDQMVWPREMLLELSMFLSHENLHWLKKNYSLDMITGLTFNYKVPQRLCLTCMCLSLVKKISIESVVVQICGLSVQS